MKLQSKQREGRKVRFVYDPAKTPLQRLLLSGVLPADTHQELTAVAQDLDPIHLFQQVKDLQQAVFRHAINTSSSLFAQNRPPVPLFLFSVECCTTGTHPAETLTPDPTSVLKTLRREQQKRRRSLDWRRTRVDPFEDVWGHITAWLKANPERTSGSIFQALQRLFPGRYQPVQIRTLQRGMRTIRAHLLEGLDEQWQHEVIHGPSSTPAEPREKGASPSSMARSE